MGGIKIKMRLGENTGFFVDSSYKFIKFKEIEGKLVSGNKELSGELYYSEVKVIDEWLPFIWLYESEPQENNLTRNIRSAEFDFSGLYVGFGLYVKF